MENLSWYPGHVSIAKIEIREDDGPVRIRLVTEDLYWYVDVEIKAQDLAAMLENGLIARCRYRSGVVAMERDE